MNSRTKACCILLTAVMVLTAAVPAMAQGRGPRFVVDTPSNAAPIDIARGHLARAERGLSADDVAALKVKNQFKSAHNGTTHIYFLQQRNGLDVVGTNTGYHIAADGRVIAANDRALANLAGRAAAHSPRFGADEAIGAAAASLGLELQTRLEQVSNAGGARQLTTWTGGGVSRSDIPAHLVYMPSGDGLALTWSLVIDGEDGHLRNILVDAETNTVSATHDWTYSDSYEVYAQPKDSPNDGPRTVEVDPADATGSPFGWHDTDGSAGAEFTTTRGNNVCAQEDRDGNNSACATGFQPNGGGALDFTGAVVPLDLSTQSPGQYQAAAIANLFYFNNVMHDNLHRYGFDEVSGNFQENNYGRGGNAGDGVNADAQDNADGNPPSTDNANFSTPPEGGPFNPHPRMQMFEWTPPFINETVVDSGAAAGSYGSSDAGFGPALTLTGVSGNIVLVNDGTGTTTDGCEALSGLSGAIALIDRGSCSFVTKVRNAQNAGAVGVVVANNVGGNPIGLGDDGTGGDITIPSTMVSLNDGTTIKGGLPSTGTIRRSPSPPPNRDSDLDNGIIAHEYCHGLSIRLTGGSGTSNCLSGDQQAGEGWSDLCALFFTAKVGDAGTDPRGVGGYSIFDATPGATIRTFPYSTDMAINPHTYGEIALGTLSVPHGIGSVWAMAAWEMYWALVDDQGFDPDHINGTAGNNVAIQLVVDGLKLQGCDPTFVDARDAILLADQNNNGGANQCLIWSAFAKRGLGVNANDGGGATSLAVTEDFDVPLSCVTGCGNLICEAGEDCNNCPSDCVGGTAPGAVCGNGVCETADGESCVSCAADCAGTQGGKPANRFCCGDGNTGDGPVTCSDSRCTSGGFACTTDPAPGGGAFCCGDLSCDAGESCGNCGLDCNSGAEVCTGGTDEDCDGDIDCADSDCSGDPACQGGGVVCSDITSKNPCNAEATCRWDNRSKTCVDA